MRNYSGPAQVARHALTRGSWMGGAALDFKERRISAGASRFLPKSQPRDHN